MKDPQQLRLVGDDETPAAKSTAKVRSRRPRKSATRELESEPVPVQMLSDYGEVLTVEEAATVLRISRASAYEAARVWRATGSEGLPVIQIGRRLLVPRSALEELLKSPAKDQLT